MTATIPDLLEAIVAATRRIVEVRQASVPAERLEALARRRPLGSAFRERLSARNRLNIVAECKRRSPSRGVLCPDYDPARIARGYAAGGAAAVSVLTEPTFFDGSLEHLTAVRAAVELPLLRKDFVVSRYQLLEAVVAGADAVLLIVAALDDATLAGLQREAQALGLATLVEVHDREELFRALGAGADLIGVNNRNLRTLQTDLDTARRLAGEMPAGTVAVAESGLRSPEELRELQALGYSAFLIGESLMLRPDPAAALRALTGAA